MTPQRGWSFYLVCFNVIICVRNEQNLKLYLYIFQNFFAKQVFKVFISVPCARPSSQASIIVSPYLSCLLPGIYPLSPTPFRLFMFYLSFFGSTSVGVCFFFSNRKILKGKRKEGSRKFAIRLSDKPLKRQHNI